MENEKRLNSFDWFEWQGKELHGAAAKEFAKALGLKNKDGSIMAISGIYKK